ncbi:hypothetical protein CCS38_03275 [Streptomyces purpurogeneiscleroticus]|nr:hypothetical protein [Streptomyces purpurogeneiscleroticus]
MFLLRLAVHLRMASPDSPSQSAWSAYIFSSSPTPLIASAAVMRASPVCSRSLGRAVSIMSSMSSS